MQFVGSAGKIAKSRDSQKRSNMSHSIKHVFLYIVTSFSYTDADVFSLSTLCSFNENTDAIVDSERKSKALDAFVIVLTVNRLQKQATIERAI